MVLGGLAAFRLLRSAPYPAAAEGESLIVMAPFVNYTGGEHGFNVHGRLREQIETGGAGGRPKGREDGRVAGRDRG